MLFFWRKKFHTFFPYRISWKSRQNILWKRQLNYTLSLTLWNKKTIGANLRSLRQHCSKWRPTKVRSESALMYTSQCLITAKTYRGNIEKCKKHYLNFLKHSDFKHWDVSLYLYVKDTSITNSLLWDLSLFISMFSLWCKIKNICMCS